MKMRWRVVVEEHSDQDAVKCADGGHEAEPILALSLITPEKLVSGPGASMDHHRQSDPAARRRRSLKNDHLCHEGKKKPRKCRYPRKRCRSAASLKSRRRAEARRQA